MRLLRHLGLVPHLLTAVSALMRVCAMRVAVRDKIIVGLVHLVTNADSAAKLAILDLFEGFDVLDAQMNL